jgi:hypothetical protein
MQSMGNEFINRENTVSVLKGFFGVYNDLQDKLYRKILS